LGDWVFWLGFAVFVGLVDAFVYEVCLFLWDVKNFKLSHCWFEERQCIQSSAFDSTPVSMWDSLFFHMTYVALCCRDVDEYVALRREFL
jgi:hypothetical protein